jgi:uncharacterized protein YukE
VASGDAFTVDPAILDDTALRLGGRAGEAAQLADAARDARVPAGSWGALGRQLGLPDHYSRLLGAADRSLDEVQRFLATAEEAVKATAQSYAEADTAAAGLFDDIAEDETDEARP